MNSAQDGMFIGAWEWAAVCAGTGCSLLSWEAGQVLHLFLAFLPLAVFHSPHCTCSSFLRTFEEAPLCVLYLQTSLITPYLHCYTLSPHALLHLVTSHSCHEGLLAYCAPPLLEKMLSAVSNGGSNKWGWVCFSHI